MKKCFLLPVVFLLSVSCLMSQGIQFVENKPWQEILNMAASQNKLVFLDCYTTWCGPCKAMAKDVFPLEEVGKFMNANFINVKQDMEKGEGIELNKKYKKYIPGYPTYLLVNGQGEVVHQVAGYNAADKFIAKIGDGLKQRSWIAMSAKYDAGQRDWEFIQDYFALLEDAYQTEKIKQVKEEVLPKLNISLITENASAYKVFRKYWTDAETPLMRSFLASPFIYRKHKDAEKEVNDWAGRIYRRSVDEYVKKSATSPKTYDTAKAHLLIDDLRRTSVFSRENMIALMLLSEAVVNNDGNGFLKIQAAAKDFGMLRYDKGAIGNWARCLAERTTDKALLKRYLACAQFKEEDMLTTPTDIRNYAFILQKMGDKTKAQEYYTKADRKEAGLKEKFNSLLNNK